ncbi:MAG: GTPase HflX [Chloroflexi bacterium]|nr:GTPase HflX [Chloroflexota bacterium]
MSTRPKAERVLLIGVSIKGKRTLWTPDDSLAELAELTRSAGAYVVGSVAQKLEKRSFSYIGQGKLEEIKVIVASERIGTIICDDELTPAQQQKLEAAFKDVKIIDRTALILDIFARRAQTREGRLQVELAQMEYLLPRLAGQWSHLERLGGGIGTRGPGETQLETDRRLVRNRILRLKRDIEAVRRHRELYRARRRQQEIPVVSLVGYTNAGKSTLMNALTGAGVQAEDKLFMTLDPVTRRITLPSGKQALLTDTVGFIQKLPTTLVAAFRATLEEITEASLILHVLDATHQNAPEQAEVVEEVLRDLGVAERPRILALNKADLLNEEDAMPLHVDIMASSPIMVSALRGDGLDALRGRIEQALESEEGGELRAQTG